MELPTVFQMEETIKLLREALDLLNREIRRDKLIKKPTVLIQEIEVCRDKIAESISRLGKSPVLLNPSKK